MNADEIYQSAKAEIPKISVGTVYRNLLKFEEEGLIRRVPIQGAPDRFDKNVHDHAHAVCINCGNICDVSMEHIKEMIEEKSDIEIISVDISMKYICNNCKIG